MAMKFKGSSTDLEKRLTDAGIEGKWTDDGFGKFTFRSANKGVLNYWKSTRTINFQGRPAGKMELLKVFTGGNSPSSRDRDSTGQPT